jgi:preprotein translocase subunit YajC
VSIANLSSAPDLAGPRSELDAPMHLHLSLPDGLAHEADWFAIDPAAVAIEGSDSGGGDDNSNTGSTIVSFLPLLLIVVAVYFLLLRPRQRQMRQQRELQSSLDVGDEVMLTSGVYGFITGFEPGSDIIWVEIDDDVQIRVSRAAVSGKVDTSGAAAAASGGDTAGAEASSPVTTSRRPTLKGGAREAKDGGTAAPAAASDDATGDEPAAE